ncbi:magnesium transporter [Ruegeria sp. Ofav3-42]|uniref:magnesium transporter n=1 Tax=Ruegeria sp. Ofav3-42 TaxID=2917759 RepID=UPI001EF642AC|nr:magnesium transporter [Ruegeria sp. Ofav3-42]MCG7518062.1 magnesium transporter [Ruegeria sp. Ofav3-42]
MDQVRPSEMNWDSSKTPEAKRNNAAVVQSLEALIALDKRLAVLSALKGWQSADILKCLLKMRPKRARRLFEWLPDDVGLPVLVELDPELRSVLYEAATRKKFRKIVSKISRDDAIELLEALPPETHEDLIADRKDADKLHKALAVHDDSAAAHMRHGVLTIPVIWTIGDVVSHLRDVADDIDRLDMMFVVESDMRLVGYLRMRDLLLNPESTRIEDIVRRDPVTVDGATDQEEVLRLADARDASVIAVVDADGRFLGGIAPPELSEIAREEVGEDMLKMGGVSPDATQFDTPLQILRRRLPWLLGGLIGSSIAAVAIVSYEDALAESAILASFIPVVLATAGNAGIQASTVSVQVLTSGVEWRGDLASRFVRELYGALLNGLIVGSVVGILVLLGSLFIPIDRPGLLVVTSIVALAIVTIIAASVGAMVPFLLRALKQDPAAATGIFITTSNDVFGVLTFFAVASLIYLN